MTPYERLLPEDIDQPLRDHYREQELAEEAADLAEQRDIDGEGV